MILLFKDLNLVDPIQRALESEGYTKPTPIQEQAIPELLQGKDLLGCAQTGTGKTAAFAIPILQKLSYEKPLKKEKRQIKALVVAPTRELAIQIGDNFKKYSANLRLKTLMVYGGVSQHPQTKQLKRGVDILVATPGRLLDLINQGHISLKNVQHFVLDEADLMLDMGMIDDVKKIVKFIPDNRQTMLFSATMPVEIEKLTKAILKDPVKVEITPVSSTAEKIKQEVYFVDQGNKTNLLIHLLKDDAIESALVFSRTKHGADKIVGSLGKAGFSAQAIHGNKTQKARQRALNNFKQRKTKILVATDIAARGIDIAALSHVINYNLPEVPETYVHRIGRTGRSGNSGVAISFSDHQEKSLLRNVQKLIDKTIPENTDNPYPLSEKPKKKNSNKSNFRRKKRRPSSRKSNNSNHSNQAEHSGRGRRSRNKKGRNTNQANKNNKNRSRGRVKAQAR
jgi:ATP-dependent RNA helicase RhlE